LLNLRNKLENPKIDMVYALWPDDGGESLYRNLADIRSDLFTAHSANPPAVISQRISIRQDARLRALLTGYFDDPESEGFLSPKEAAAALEVIKTDCATTAIINAGSRSPDQDFMKALGWAARQPLPPTGSRAAGNRPGQ
jgi:hypothetical protein